MEEHISITGEHITLSQMLKKLNLISSGGEARIFLSEHRVIVNGQAEDRRGRKLYQGDRLEIGTKTYLLV